MPKVTEDKIEKIAYLKYTGGSTDEGIIGVNDIITALEGFDEMFKYFLSHEDLALSNIEFDIPVRIKQGSIDISIPNSIAGWLSASAGAALTFYLSTTAKEAAKDGLLSTGTAKDITLIFKNTFKMAIFGIKIAKHVGTFTQKTFENVKFRKNNEEIGILNSSGNYIYVPVKYMDIYKKCPKKVFSKIVQPINDLRNVEVGVLEDGTFTKESITKKEREIFYFGDKNDEDILFPELIHGENVGLEGEITRATENTQTIGFKYKNHILTCKPSEGGLVAFKKQIISQKNNHIYNTKIKMIGIVNRKDVNGKIKEKRPQIIFSQIVSLESEANNNSLFKQPYDKNN